MPFPATQRVIYQRNPLDRVIVQLRFPPILRIEADVPADFQDRIRADFPRYEETLESPSIGLPPGMSDQLPDEIIVKMTQGTAKKNYVFLSRDGSWKINLTRTFLALTTTDYERWEGFREKLIGPLEALVEIYSPLQYSRIGLRYIDVINRSALGLDGMSWTDLLQPHLTGALSSAEVGEQVEEFQSRHQVGLSDGESKVRIVAGLAESADNGEICFKIDSDFFNENETALESSERILEYLRKRGSRLFRWAITDQLHEAMQPEALC